MIPALTDKVQLLEQEQRTGRCAVYLGLFPTQADFPTQVDFTCVQLPAL